MDDGVGIATVVGEHVAGDHRIRLEWVCSGGIGTQSGSFIDIGAVCVESELVELSQTSASVEWGRSIVCVQPEDWIGKCGE